jgi:hypothetical protein
MPNLYSVAPAFVCAKAKPKPASAASHGFNGSILFDLIVSSPVDPLRVSQRNEAN